jgi:soluble lytic murein transglycosylase-like protein
LTFQISLNQRNATAALSGWVLMRGFVALLSASMLSHGHAVTLDAATLAHESAVVGSLLEQARSLERSTDDQEGPWQAATRYCEASRLGSTEAQYRLGMLFAFGRGVPESREMAASLFSLAALQGHAEAQNMLETIRITSALLPACVLEAVAPEKGFGVNDFATSGAGIDRFLLNLPKNRRWVVDLVGPLARWNAVDPKLILSIIATESNFQNRARSPKAAMGLMQLIPETAERFNVNNAYNATQNIKGGLAYVRWLLSYYRGDVRLALAAYNAGEGTVDRYKGIPPYKETRQYVQRVMALYGQATHPFDGRAGKVSPSLK